MKPQNDFKIYNPDIEDLTITYDINNNAQPVSFTLHGRELASFPGPVNERMQETLADKLAWKRGWQGSNYEDKVKEIIKEITIYP